MQNDTNVASLEDFISFSDDFQNPYQTEDTQLEGDKDKGDLDDNLEDDIIDDDNDLDDIDDVNKDSGNDTNKVIDSAEDLIDDADDDEMSNSQLEALYEALLEEGALDLPDDFKFDGTPKSFNTAIDTTFSNLTTKAQNALLDQLSPEVRDVVRYNLTTQKGVNDFLKEKSNVPVIGELDITNEDNQKYVLAEHYKATTNYSPEKIRKLISRIEDLGELEYDAKEAYQELLELKINQEEKNKKDYEARQEQIRNQKAQEKQLYESLVQESTLVEKARKEKLRNFLVNEHRVKGENVMLTGMSRTLQEISRNPEHIVQLADLLLDYDKGKGLALDRFEKKQVAKKTKEVLSRMDRVLDPQKRMRGDSINEKSKTEFDFGKWAALTD